MEFFPTFLAAAGAKPPAGLKLDGYNMLPVLEGKAESPRKECFYQAKDAKAARVGKWKWVESEKGAACSTWPRISARRHDLSAQKPEVLAMMKARWAEWRKEMDDSEPSGPFRDY